MRVRHLKTFVVAAESGNFAQAADRLNMTPSAVSLQMKTLEEALSTSLFDRTVRPAQLTPQGRAILPNAKEIVSLYDRLLVQASGDELSGQIRIGAVGTTLTGILPRALSALQSRHPNLAFQVVDGFSSDLVSELEADAFDVVLISEPAAVPDGYDWRPVANETLVVIAPLDCTAAYDEEVLRAYPYIRFDRRAWYSHLVDEQLKQRGIEVVEKMSFRTLEAVSTMVFFGHGVSIVPLRYLNQPFPMALKRFPFGHPPVHRGIGILSRQDHEKQDLIHAFHMELLAQRGMEARET